MGIGSTLLGDAGMWGFLVFFLGLGAAVFWLIAGFVLKKVGHLKDALLPATEEATLRRRLFFSSLKRAVRRESNAALEQLSRLERIWKSIDAHLRSQLSPTELTFARYEGAVKASCRATLEHLERSTESIETLGVLESDGGSGYMAPSDDRVALRNGRRRFIREQLEQAGKLLDALERLDLALTRDLNTQSDRPSLDTMVQDLKMLAERAHVYANP